MPKCGNLREKKYANRNKIKQQNNLYLFPVQILKTIYKELKKQQIIIYFQQIAQVFASMNKDSKIFQKK